jgi:DNA-directed RNA polymerase specialized sigma24 family protein
MLQTTASTADEERINRLVDVCQQSLARWERESDPAKHDELRAHHRQCLEQLWQAIEPDLRKVASGWVRSGMGDITTLAMSMFVAIITVLPRLSIDPTKRTRGLLITIGRWGLIDEHRKYYANGSRRPSNGTSSTSSYEVSLDSMSEQVASEQPHGDETVDRIDQQRLLEMVLAFWRANLTELDFLIMQLRWCSDPQFSFRDIAQHLGPGWEEGAVRKRHHRVMERTRAYLREQGFTDGDEYP